MNTTWRDVFHITRGYLVIPTWWYMYLNGMFASIPKPI